MSVIAIAVKHLLLCGATPEQVCVAVTELERAVQPVRSAGAIRQERYRHKASLGVTKRNEVTEGDAKEISPTPPKENTNNLTVVSNSPPLVPPSKTEPERFSEFWAVYPPRAGNRDRKAGLKAYAAALKRGVTPDEIIIGARAYAAFGAATGKLHTELIRQARTWLNGNGWTESYGPSNTSTPGSRAAAWAIVDANIAELERQVAADEAQSAQDGTNQCEEPSGSLPRLRENAA